MPIGRPRMYDDDRVQIQIRIDPKLLQRLKKEALRRCVSKNLLVERAIEEALNTWEGESLVASNR